MRLEPLFEGTLRYDDGSVWVQPYGGEEGAGYGTGTGELRGGPVEGAVRWANCPRRREDGVWLPDLRGAIRTGDGADIVMSMNGISIRTSGEPVRRSVTCAVTFQTDDDRYQWLNLTFAALEGEIDETTAVIDLRAFQCVNEFAS